MSIQRQPWWIILATLALFLAACGTTTSHNAATKSTGQGSAPSRSATKSAAVSTSATQARCTVGALGATMDAHLANSCYRIPNLASGTYYLGVEAVLSPRGATAAKDGFPVPSAHSGPAVSLTVSPLSVTPGATVTITGRLSTPLSPQPAHTNVCFDGCIDGLHYNGTSVRWISPTEFQTSFVTPSGPWLERYPLRLALPKAGSYPVAVQCLGVHRACALASGEGSTTLAFKHSMKTALPHLSLSSTKVLPGEMTAVRGTIALSNIIGKAQPFVDQFAVLKKSPTKTITKGVYQLPPSAYGKYPAVLLGPVKFRVITPLTYESISLKGAANIQPSADPSIVTESGVNGVALTCSGSQRDQANAMRLLSEGQSRVVNTEGVATLLRQKGVPTYLADSEPCSDLAALHTSAGETLIAASYAIEIPNQAPAFAYLPVISANDGTTWTTIPPPNGATDASFAGLQASHSGIRAYFAIPHHAEIVESTDNGTSWTEGPLSCPSLGPCIQFSPTTDLFNCAMNGADEPILLSTNEGRSFTTSSWPSSVNACGPNELFSVDGTEYLIDPQSSFPLRRSTDGGVQWQAVSDIPTPPGVTTPGTSAPLGQTSWGETTLVLPGTGDLLSIGSGIDSALLTPHAHHWCNVPAAIIPTDVGAATTGEHNLYFVTYSSSTTTTFTSIPLTSLRCSS
ncbi:hypothetical protein [Ferrimicrobium sp.]|uniref:WD40/YVTN/BNR-like repeat-containing protein n=1 Tax=Ferrimicrobium sp. TaxID=2926050 RepID=UPI00260FB64F|nr:hypothetical protein [Ferrimicrobium sp.]